MGRIKDKIEIGENDKLNFKNGIDIEAKIKKGIDIEFIAGYGYGLSKYSI